MRNAVDLTSAKVLADSTYLNGTRLITVEATFPRFILAEVNTHRALSRNSASSRAIPVAKQIERIREHPFVPQSFPVNRPGMSADEFLGQGTKEYDWAKMHWLMACEAALRHAQYLLDLGIHKQIASRTIEPYMWHTAIISATVAAWSGVFQLRCHPSAQPEFQTLAVAIRKAIAESTPRVLEWNEWHLPLTGFPGDESLSLANLIRVSAARCARVSYLTHEGVRDVDADLKLYERLSSHLPPHLSPLEHPAQPCQQPPHYANFTGWRQARYFVEHQADLPGENIQARRFVG